MKGFLSPILVCALVATVSPAAREGARGDAADAIVSSIDAKRDAYAEVATQIWGFAEVGYQEEQSSALLQAHLSAAGFSVTKGVAEIPTAFMATYGSGKPVIAIVGEFDALPGLSQEAVPERKPRLENGPGHGCG
ncbi:MAG: amidohydrolase, partial [Acidobacteria bacterium]|nr:amidohydrolase [Acidobacteriota bacterium]